MLKVRYFDRTLNESVTLSVPSDVIAVEIPAQQGQEALTVHVNTDAVMVDGQDGKRVAMHEYTHDLAERDSEGYETCDECGSQIPDDEESMFNAHHSESCSLYPDNVV